MSCAECEDLKLRLLHVHRACEKAEVGRRNDGIDHRADLAAANAEVERCCLDRETLWAKLAAATKERDEALCDKEFWRTRLAEISLLGHCDLAAKSEEVERLRGAMREAINRIETMTIGPQRALQVLYGALGEESKR